MKGATAEPDSISSMLNSSSTIRIGTSHHFLFSFKKAQNSPSSPSSELALSNSFGGCSAMLLSRSKLAAVGAVRWCFGTQLPVALALGEQPPGEGIAAGQAKDN